MQVVPTKAKGETKIAQKVIREDQGIKMGISYESNILKTEVIFSR